MPTLPRNTCPNIDRVIDFIKDEENLYMLIHIPARQRAEAFLKTIGKWEDS